MFLTELGPFPAITIVSLIVSIAITLIYKFTTDQKKMSSVKQEMNRLREEMKTTKDPGKAGEINKKLLEATMEQFRASMKPMIITMIPALLIIGWMQGSLAYEQLKPGIEFTTTALFENGATGEIELIAPQGIEISSESKQKAADEVTWKLKGNEGNYELQYNYGEETYAKQITITNKWEFTKPTLEKPKGFLGINTGDEYPIKAESQLREIKINNKPVHPFGEINLFGWIPGWLATYIITSLGFSMLFRALLKVN